MAAGHIYSNLYAAGQQSPSVYPNTLKKVIGSVVIPAGTSFATTDILSLFQFPGPASFFDEILLDMPELDSGGGAGGGVTFALKDNLTSPTTFFTSTSTNSASAGWLATTLAAHGTMGAASNAGAGYVSGVEIRLIPATASSATTGSAALTIYFEAGISNS
jgi:hypothetical protein